VRGRRGAIIVEMREVGDRIREYDDRLKIVEEQVSAFPHSPESSARVGPCGQRRRLHTVARTWGELPSFGTSRGPIGVGVALGILDFERAAKITGSRSPCSAGRGEARRALINFMLDVQTRENGYREVLLHSS